jgi:cyclophilin family peptidyl-prolyl cis-trans isomerase
VAFIVHHKLRGHLPVHVIAGIVALALAGCGGGGGSSPSTAVELGPAAYHRPLSITVTGEGADQESLQVVADGCDGMARVPQEAGSGAAAGARFQCTPMSVGSVTLSVVDGTGRQLASRSVQVPMPQVTLTISNGGSLQGSIELTLDPAKAPITVDNFLQYVDDRYYDGTIFHRVVPGFVIQGGGYLPLNGGTPVAKTGLRAPIPLEVNTGLTNRALSVAMARTTDPNSATSQFFINLVDNPGLDPSANSAGYAVFGSVTAGADVVNAIANAPGKSVPGFSDPAPAPDVVITSAVRSR